MKTENNEKSEKKQKSKCLGNKIYKNEIFARSIVSPTNTQQRNTKKQIKEKTGTKTLVKNYIYIKFV